MSGNCKILSHLLMIQLPRSQRYSESFGKLQSLRPLFDIMAGKKEGDPLETYLATDTYLGNFLKWLDPSKRSIILPAKRLRDAIVREARLLNPRQTK